MTDYSRRALAAQIMSAMRLQIRTGCHVLGACERCGTGSAVIGHGPVCGSCLRDELAEVVSAVAAYRYFNALTDVVSAHRAIDEVLDRMDEGCPG